MDSVRKVSWQNTPLGNRKKMAKDWEKARDWLKQKSITRMSAKVNNLEVVLLYTALPRVQVLMRYRQSMSFTCT